MKKWMMVGVFAAMMVASLAFVTVEHNAVLMPDVPDEISIIPGN